MFTPTPDRLSELVACDWTLLSVCLHDCVGEMEEEEVGGRGGVHVQAASGSGRQDGDQATLQRGGGGG